MSREQAVYCRECHVEYSPAHSENCPLCDRPPIRTDRRAWGWTEPLFHTIGDTSRPVVRLHADQGVIGRRSGFLWCLPLFGVGLGLVGAIQSHNQDGDQLKAVLLVTIMFVFSFVVMGLFTLTFRAQRPIEVLETGMLRIPRALQPPHGAIGMAIQTVATAAEDAASRKYFCIARDEWVRAVQSGIDVVATIDTKVAELFPRSSAQLRILANRESAQPGPTSSATPPHP